MQKAIEIRENRIGFVRLSKAFIESVSLEEYNKIFENSKIVKCKLIDEMYYYTLYRKDFRKVKINEIEPEYRLNIYTDDNVIESVSWIEVVIAKCDKCGNEIRV